MSRSFTASGRLSSWTEPNGDTFSRIYDGAGRVQEEIDALGNSTVYGYDAAGRLERIVDLALEATTRFERDSAGRVTKTIDELGNETSATYRLGRRLRSLTNARNFTTTLEQTATSTTVVDPFGRRSTTVLSPYGLPLEAQYAGAAAPTTGITYHGTTHLDGSQAFPASYRDEHGRVRQLQYDSQSGLSAAADTAGNAWRYEYSASRPSGMRYDVFGGAVAPAHHRGGASAYASQVRGQQYRDVDPVGTQLTSTFTHTLSRVTSPLGNSTEILRGTNGRIESVRLPDGGERRVEYRGDGTPSLIALPQGTTLSIEHDSALREVSRTSSTGETRRVTYGAGDRIESLADNTGITDFQYDSAGRFSGLTYPHGGSVMYTRDTRGRTVGVSVAPSQGASSLKSSYTYDATGNIATVTDPFGGVTQFAYDDADRLVEKTLPNGVTTSYGYDERDRVLSIVHEDLMGTVLQSLEYERSLSGEPTKITREDGSFVEYTYDAALRLDTETYYDASGTLADAIDYDYDEDGNRTSKSSLSGGFEDYSYSSGFRLNRVARAGSADVYGYDGGGRVASVERSDGLLELQYNSDDKITHVRRNGVEVARYQYDGLGRRVEAANGSSTLRYLTAPNLGDGYETPQLVVDGSGTVVEGYVFAGEHPILRFDGSGNVEYYLQDELGSVTGILDAHGSVTASARYDAFGSVRAGNVGSEAVGGGFGLHGMWFDDASSLYHVRARFYDPGVGRFVSRDPVLGFTAVPETFNSYSFVQNAPTLFRDPSGRFRATLGFSIRLIITRVLAGAARIGTAFARNAIRALQLATGIGVAAAPIAAPLLSDRPVAPTITGYERLLEQQFQRQLDNQGLRQIRAMSTVNFDTGALVAMSSASPDHKANILGQLGNRQIVATRTAIQEFISGNLPNAGTLETAAAMLFLQNVRVVPDMPSARAQGLSTTNSLEASDIVIFGTGDNLGIQTFHGDRQAVRAAAAQGVDFFEFDFTLGGPGARFTGQ